MESNSFLFTALGGVGNIGMNVSAYHFNGKWIVVDLGIGFADETMPGIELLVADIGFLASKKDDLLGIVLTHAHEDHLGAIQYLWGELGCPVYCSKFTTNFLKAKVKDCGMEGMIPIHEVDKEINLGPFLVQFVHMTHSIPDARLLAISCSAGMAVHTGDWKIDDNPIVGPLSELDRLREISKDGVSCLICDSTNVFKDGISGSESTTVDGLKRSVSSAPGKMVAVSVFASNITRIKTIHDVAKECGREVALLGRSLKRAVSVAKESGYLDDVDILSDEKAASLDRGKVLLICTGCQGERFAASMKLALNAYEPFKLVSGDKIIFSSKIIPGNEKRIFGMFNMFVKSGVEVVTETDDLIHVSGHPSRDELKVMYDIVKPKYAIPVHGEYMHMTEHVKLAKGFGVEKAIVISPGDVIDLSNLDKVSTVNTGYFGVEGNFLHHPDGDVMKMRRRLRDTGTVVVTIILGKTSGKLMKKPSVFAPGVFDRYDENHLSVGLASAVEEALKSKKMKRLRSDIESIVRSFLKVETGNRPFVEIQIERV